MTDDKWAEVAVAYSKKNTAWAFLRYKTWRGSEFSETVGSLFEQQQRLLTEAAGRTGADVSSFQQGMEAMARGLTNRSLGREERQDVFQYDIAHKVVSVLRGRETALRETRAEPNQFDRGLQSFALAVFDCCGINTEPLEKVLSPREDGKPSLITGYRII